MNYLFLLYLNNSLLCNYNVYKYTFCYILTIIRNIITFYALQRGSIDYVFEEELCSYIHNPIDTKFIILAIFTNDILIRTIIIIGIGTIIIIRMGTIIIIRIYRNN